MWQTSCSKQKVFIKVATWNYGHTSSRNLVRDLLLRKAASPVTLAANYLTSIFYGFWQWFSIVSREPLFAGQFLAYWMFSFLFILCPLEIFKTKLSNFNLLIKVFYEGKNIDCMDIHLKSWCKTINHPQLKPIHPISCLPCISNKFFSSPNYPKFLRVHSPHLIRGITLCNLYLR